MFCVCNQKIFVFININMIYLVSSFPCVIAGEEKFKIDKSVRYCVENVDNTPQIVYPMDNSLPFSISFNDILNNIPHENATTVEIHHNQYIFLNPNTYLTPTCTQFKCLNNDINITISRSLLIQINGESLLNENLQTDIVYSHFEVVGEFCIIFFEGKRNYFVIIEGKTFKCADYFDEINSEKDELYFLTRAFDSLNHGKVRHIKNKTYEEYAVYLDSEQVNIDINFIPIVFLDCLRVGNFNFCNSMLSDSIKQEDSKNIKTFFPEFDDYYPIEDNIVILFKKNAPQGKFKFELNLEKIENIIQID